MTTKKNKKTTKKQQKKTKKQQKNNKKRVFDNCMLLTKSKRLSVWELYVTYKE